METKVFRQGENVIITSGKYKQSHGKVTCQMGPEHYEVSIAGSKPLLVIVESARLELLPRSMQTGPDLDRAAQEEIIAQAQAQAARAMSAADAALRRANEEHRRKEASAAARREFTREVRWHLKEYGEKETRALFNNTVREWKEGEL